MDKRSDRPTLSKLYKSEHIRNTVWDILSEDFENSFDRLMKEAKNVRSLLVNSAKANKCLIKELVIEYGFEFENLENLKTCLDELKLVDKMDECDHSSFSDGDLIERALDKEREEIYLSKLRINRLTNDTKLLTKEYENLIDRLKNEERICSLLEVEQQKTILAIKNVINENKVELENLKICFGE